MSTNTWRSWLSWIPILQMPSIRKVFKYSWVLAGNRPLVSADRECTCCSPSRIQLSVWWVPHIHRQIWNNLMSYISANLEHYSILSHNKKHSESAWQVTDVIVDCPAQTENLYTFSDQKYNGYYNIPDLKRCIIYKSTCKILYQNSHRCAN